MTFECYRYDNAMTMKPTMVQLSLEDRDVLARAAADEGVSRSELVRRALRHYLEERTEAVVSRRIRQGYEQLPESDAEIVAATAAARRMLSDPDLEW